MTLLRADSPLHGPYRVTPFGFDVPYLDVTSRVYVEGDGATPELSHDHDPDHLWYFGVETGRGKVFIELTIAWPDYHVPGHPSIKADNVRVDTVMVPYTCTPKGDPEVLRPGNDFELPQPRRQVIKDKKLKAPFSLAFEAHFSKTHPDDPHKDYVPDDVSHKWMTQLNVLRIDVIVTVTLADQGEGSITLEAKPENVPVLPLMPGVSLRRNARLSPLTIFLDPIGMPPPISTHNGILFGVYFEKDSSDIYKIVEMPGTGKTPLFWHQAGILEGFVKDLYSRWEVAAALSEKKTLLTLDAYASATYKGMSGTDLKKSPKLLSEAFQYNKDLADKRKRVVVDRLLQLSSTPSISDKGPPLVEGKNLITNTHPMTGELGEENPFNRRCEIRLDGDEVVKYIKEAFGRKPGGPGTKR